VGGPDSPVTVTVHGRAAPLAPPAELPPPESPDQLPSRDREGFNLPLEEAGPSSTIAPVQNKQMGGGGRTLEASPSRRRWQDSSRPRTKEQNR
jgi:hypothetical protein